jgi:hypothetical protein
VLTSTCHCTIKSLERRGKLVFSRTKSHKNAGSILTVHSSCRQYSAMPAERDPSYPLDNKSLGWILLFWTWQGRGKIRKAPDISFPKVFHLVRGSKFHLVCGYFFLATMTPNAQISERLLHKVKVFIFGFCILLLLEEQSLATTLKAGYFIYISLLLHVSALVGHLQVECTIISGCYFLQRIRCFVLLGPIFYVWQILPLSVKCASVSCPNVDKLHHITLNTQQRCDLSNFICVGCILLR